MTLWYLMDAIVVIIYVIAILFFKKRGFLKSSETVISIILSLCLMTMVLPYFEAAIEKSPAGDIVREKVEQKIMPEQEGEKELAMPDFFKKTLDNTLKTVDEAKTNILKETAEQTSALIIRIISVLLFFILIKIGIFLLFRILEVCCHLKIMEFVNSTLGIILGFINATVIIYVLCALMMIFMPEEHAAIFKDAISKTYLLGFFYNHNLLIELFL